MGNSCVRISVLKLTWAKAEQKCKSEGAHLATIHSEEIQRGLKKLINGKIDMEVTEFQPPYAADTETFWTGGTVRHINEWKWISSLENLTSYSKWKDDTEGSGCLPPGFCLDSQAIVIKGSKYEWSADDKSKEYPYICLSECDIGYIWQKTAKKCVKIVRNETEKRSHSQASLHCAKDQARLLSVKSCKQFEGLLTDLQFFWKNSFEQYWIGLYIGQPTYRRATAQQTRSTDGAGWTSLSVHTDTDCDVHPDKVKMVDASDQDIQPDDAKEYYAELAYYNVTTMKGRIKLHEYSLVDQSTQQMFLCEKETDWMCPDGYIMFREDCYKLFDEDVISAEAELRCKEEGGKVLELSSKITLNFISAWLNDQDYSPPGVWLGYQRHTNTMNTSQDMEYLAFDGSSQFNHTSFNFAGLDSASGDCLLLKQSEGSYSSFEQIPCDDTAHYVCQQEQVPTISKAKVIPKPQFLLPLDKTAGYDTVTKYAANNNQTLVAITEQAVPSRLVGAADFLRNFDSHLELSADISVSVKFGVTILVWLYVAEEIENNKKIFVIDGSDVADDNSFKFFIENQSGKILLGAQLCNSDLNCSVYHSQSDLSLELYQWHFVGFTFSVDNMLGTFIINDTFGYSDLATGKTAEASYFSYDTAAWLHTGALKGSIMVGSEKGSISGFGGKLSCLQLYEMFFSPSQVRQVKRCPVPDSHDRYRDCPEGFHLYKESCFKVSEKERDFPESELHCSSEPDSPYLTRLAFPPDYRTQEYLSNLIMTKHNITQVWVGLDIRSDASQSSDSWTTSDGDKLNEILWLDGQPENVADQQCAFMDNSNING